MPYAVIYLPTAEFVEPYLNMPFIFSSWDEANALITSDRVLYSSRLPDSAIFFGNDERLKRLKQKATYSNSLSMSKCPDLVPKHLLEIIEINNV